MSIKQSLNDFSKQPKPDLTPRFCADDDVTESTVEQKPRNSGKAGDMTPDTQYRGDYMPSADI